MIDLMYVIMGLFSTLVAGAFSGTNMMGHVSTNLVFNFINGNVLGTLVDGGTAIFTYFLIYWILFAVALILAIVASLL